METCSACGEPLPPGATRCGLCLVAVEPRDADVYDLSADDAQLPETWEGGAVYTLESPARCPHCKEFVRSVRVLRLRRTLVSFTSPLPRGGRVVVCASCQTIIAADVSTL